MNLFRTEIAIYVVNNCVDYFIFFALEYEFIVKRQHKVV